MSLTLGFEPFLPTERRRFHTVDAMILTAGAAIAFMPPWGQFLIAIPSKCRA